MVALRWVNADGRVGNSDEKATRSKHIVVLAYTATARLGPCHLPKLHCTNSSTSPMPTFIHMAS